MDSGNSGSMQSSSAGDEEYDSRADHISPFLNNIPNSLSGSSSSSCFGGVVAATGSLSLPLQQPGSLSSSTHNPPPPTLFDPQFPPYSHSPNTTNPLYNLDLVWNHEPGLRIISDHNHHQQQQSNYPNLGNFTAPASSLGPTQGPFPGPSSLHQPNNNGGFGIGIGIGKASTPTTTPTTPRSDQNQTTAAAATGVKNSRKRTRASRRAPTTVLTTDTSNFRQMVQEFTGIPAPPFSPASSSPYSRRLDLFTGGGAGSALGPLYPFRPSTQKGVRSPSSSPLLTTAIANNINPITSNNSNSFSSSPFQLPNSDLGFPQTTNNSMLNNLQNPILTSHSLLFGSSKTQGNSGIPSLGELGITQDHLSANLSAFLSDGKGIGRENNVIPSRNEEGTINSWIQNQEI